MRANREIFEQFYATLAEQGSTEHLQRQLEDVVDYQTATPSLQDPFVRLFEGAEYAVTGAIEKQMFARLQTKSLDAATMSQLESIPIHAPAGLALWIGALRGLSRRYVELAEVPQHETRVLANVDTARRFVTGIAHSEPAIAAKNFLACKVGKDPHGMGIDPSKVKLNMLGLATSFSPNTFDAQVDAAGQLTIQPAFERLTDTTSGRSCPALQGVVTLAEHGEARTVQGFKMFLGAIGRVAINVIYPTLFDISPAE